MSYTIEQLFTRACSLVDSLKNDGTVDAGTTADYKARTLTLVDMAQKELLQNSDYTKIYEFNRFPVRNMLGNGFTIKEYKTDTDLIYDSAEGGAKAYCFESDSGNGTAYIEDYTTGWNTLATVALNNAGTGFKQYKGSLTPTSGATKTRIRFTGTYYYNTVNVALFNYAFEVGKIPDYMPWVKYQLPTDVKSLKEVVAESQNEYYPEPAYKTEFDGNKINLYVQFGYQGKIRVEYKPVPSAPSALTDTILVDDMTAQVISYFLAMNFVATEQNEYLTGLFRNKYEQLKIECMRRQPNGFNKIKNVYGTI